MDGEMFHPDKALLNPKFEGYKLHIIPQDESIFRFPLVHRPSQTAISGKVPLTFQEVQSRITHNHLTVQGESGRAVYIDADHNLILIQLDQERMHPKIDRICELPKPIETHAPDIGVHREYPSATFLGPTSLLVSDGQDLIYLVNLNDNMEAVEANIVATFTLSSTDEHSLGSPLRIHAAHQQSPSSIIATLSSRYYPSETSEEESRDRHKRVKFDVWGVKLNLLPQQTWDVPVHFEVLWHRRGEDVPLYTTIDKERGLHLLIGGSEYRKLDTPPLPVYEPTPEEIVPISQDTGTFATLNVPSAPPPYSWTQTPDAVTIAIPLPSTTPKDKIRVLFSSTTLTLHVDLELSTSLVVAVPKYSAKKLWDGISPSSSFWTFDREAERTYGVLSLHIEKQNEGTRWSHVFAETNTGSSSPEDVDVPETLDPSELWNIREALEKYTAALQGDDTSGLGLGKGVPSLAENEVDEDVDSSVGRTAFITYVPDPSTNVQPGYLLTSYYPTPSQILSTPIPGQTAGHSSLIVKTTIDGCVFELDENLDNQQPPIWKHKATFPALAFVLASKRDTRFTYHIPDTAVLAFESGSNDRGGNVYIYYPADSKALTAKQSILRIGDGSGGALMGVGLFMDSKGQPVVACLSERELTLIRHI
ncbi:hypothetical protein AGABI1DRAFT_59080 [Agaricus bisporus var. burnettii JB137-S8]|uniref:NudC domain-containing protein 1 n=1 Tax=Agaricus bisporus var. burnettii (strain JB137-S8 / ATCC MYA-4627 / FGSC 10392) TaxID=597362 RepID=K5X8A2_AGABU|nr:uncharacterized protein AGABI1DRAFT_59080 [Agaricus bisporus var. burnettii JB137-S8]EKM79453.1 hypothetical protein AGABI1DRAFT_59080 [Agaricus bisporus var. burnettii JB137-S8]